MRSLISFALTALALAFNCKASSSVPTVTVKFYDRGNEMFFREDSITLERKSTRCFRLYERYDYDNSKNTPDDSGHGFPPYTMSYVDDSNQAWKFLGWKDRATGRLIKEYDLVDPNVTEVDAEYVALKKAPYKYFGISVGSLEFGDTGPDSYSGSAEMSSCGDGSLLFLPSMSDDWGDLFGDFSYKSIEKEDVRRALAGIGSIAVDGDVVVWVSGSVSTYNFPYVDTSKTWASEETTPDSGCSFDLTMVATSESGRAKSFKIGRVNFPKSQFRTGFWITNTGYYKVRYTLPKDFFLPGDVYTITIEVNRTPAEDTVGAPCDSVSGSFSTYLPELKVEAKSADVANHSLTIGWKYVKDDLPATFTSAQTFSIWRSSGTNDLAVNDVFQTFTCITNHVSGFEFTDKEYGTLPGAQGIGYRVVPENGQMDERYAGLLPYIKRDGSRSISCRNRVGLCLGLSKYDKKVFPDLGEHRHDAEEAQTIQEQLTTESSQGTFKCLINEECKWDNVTNKLHILAKDLQPGDEFFFYISTHGNRTGTVDEMCVGPCHALYDKTVTAEDMRSFLHKEDFKGKGVKFVGIVNTCYSGDFVKCFEGDPLLDNTAWISSSRAGEIANCGDCYSNFGVFFIDWGWKTYNAKRASVVGFNGSPVVTAADVADRQLSLYEIGKYAEIFLIGDTSSSGMQGEEFVHADLLLHTDVVNSIDQIPSDNVALVPDFEIEEDPRGVRICPKLDNTQLEAFLAIVFRPAFRLKAPDRYSFYRPLDAQGGLRPHWFFTAGQYDMYKISKRISGVIVHTPIYTDADGESGVLLLDDSEYCAFYAKALMPGGWSVLGDSKWKKSSSYSKDEVFKWFISSGIGLTYKTPLIRSEMPVRVDNKKLQLSAVGLNAVSANEDSEYTLTISPRISNNELFFRAELNKDGKFYKSYYSGEVEECGDATNPVWKITFPSTMADLGTIRCTLTPTGFSGTIGQYVFAASVQINASDLDVYPEGGYYPEDASLMTGDDADDPYLPELPTLTDEDLQLTITFNVGEHGIAPMPVTRRYGEVFGELPDVQCEGFKFEGWFTENDVEITSDVRVVASSTLYAAWKRDYSGGGDIGEGDEGVEYTWFYNIIENHAVIEREDDWGLGVHFCAVDPEPVGAITVPSTLGGKPVEALGTHSLWGCSQLTQVSIPTGVKAIGYGAFDECETLGIVALPDGLLDIGDYAFNGCESLGLIEIPSSVTNIGASAFKSCAWLEALILPEGLLSIKAHTFQYCEDLGMVNVPNSVTNIGEDAFYDCLSLKNIVIPEKVVCIGDGAFENCESLTNLTFEGDAPEVGERTFSCVDGFCTVTVYEDSLGWDDDGDGYWNDLEIVWRKRGSDPISETVTITFDPNGGSCDVSESSVESGATLANLPTASRLGYVFKGWFAKATGGDEVTAKTVFTEARTVYARWERVVYQSEVEGDSDDVTQGGAVVGHIVRMYTFDEKTEGCTNWVCTGWVGTGDVPATGTSNEVSFVVKDGGTIKWLYQTNYWMSVGAVSGTDGGGTPSLPACAGGHVAIVDAAGVAITNELWAAAGTNLTAEATASEGWLFAEWREADGGRGATALPDGGHAGRVTLPVTHSWMLDAAFTQKVFAVTFDLGEHGTRKGGGALTQNVSYGAAAVAPNVTVAKDYAFNEWSAAFDCVNSNMTVRALYHSLMSHVGVSFVDGCSRMGKVTGGDKGMKAGAKVTLKATANAAKTAAGKTAAEIATVFAGWYWDAAGTTPADDGWLNPSYSFTMPAKDVTLYAKFIAQTDDVAAVSMMLPEEMANGETIENVTVDVSGCSSLPTVKVTGLPTGLKFTTKLVTTKVTTGSGKDKVTTLVTNALPNTIYGTPTKSGVYTIVATVTTAGKATASCSQTVVVRKPGENVVKADVALVDAAGRRVYEESVPGKVTGMGVYAVGKKVTLKATANKGYVFAGWWDGDLVSRLASYTIAEMPTNDVELTAMFITSGLDKSNIVAKVNGMAFETTVGGGTPTLPTNIWTGVYLEWPVAASALSETTVKVAGLPSGLKFTAKDVTQKIGSGKMAQTVVVVPANTIYGAPSAASKTTTDRKTGKTTVTPSQVKVTVTTAGKSSQTFEIDTTVDPLPSWAVGTFAGPSYAVGDGTPTLPDVGAGVDGYYVVGSAPRADCVETNGTVSVTIGANGKISAKQPVDGKATSFAASYFDRYDAGEEAFHATLTAKVGKEVVTNEMSVCGGLIEAALPAGGTVAVTNGCIVADRFDAWQYNWKVEPWKSIVKVLDKETLTYCVMSDGSCVDVDASTVLGEDGVIGKVTLKLAASGAVTVSGEFAQLDADGQPVYKNKKLQTVKATGSATLVPAGDDYGLVFVYLAPKGLPPHARFVEASWAQHIVTWEYGDVEHWYVCFKPVIYLYPETNATCRVQLALNGRLTCTYPEYGADGWRDFVAASDGTLTFPNGSRYYCLYWEGETEAEWDFSSGYCVKGSETASFFADVLLEMGLTFREANEFIVYWLPLMQDNPYNIISFQGENYANAAKLSVDPQPDSILRVFMAWRPSDRFVDIPAPVIVPFERKGFTVVEWGGARTFGT